MYIQQEDQVDLKSISSSSGPSETKLVQFSDIRWSLFAFSFPELPVHIDGIGVLVNNVLRFRSLKSNNSQYIADFVWCQGIGNEIEYFLFGYIHAHALGGVYYADFTKPIY